MKSSVTTNQQRGSLWATPKTKKDVNKMNELKPEFVFCQFEYSVFNKLCDHCVLETLEDSIRTEWLETNGVISYDPFSLEEYEELFEIYDDGDLEDLIEQNDDLKQNRQSVMRMIGLYEAYKSSKTYKIIRNLREQLNNIQIPEELK